MWGVRERGVKDDVKVFGMSSWKSSRAPPWVLLSGFNCLLGPVGEVKQRQKGGQLSLLWALELREWAAHTAYSIILCLLALLAFVISLLSPVWCKGYKCDGLNRIQKAQSSLLNWPWVLGLALPASTILQQLHRPACRRGLVWPSIKKVLRR
jgi:hypothetical protein